MGKVSNKCTCPNKTYANCQRTSHCARCGDGYCTYGSDSYIRKGYCCSIWDEKPISNQKNTKSPYDKQTAKIYSDNCIKYGTNGLTDYQNLSETNWEKYTSNKRGRYPTTPKQQYK